MSSKALLAAAALVVTIAAIPVIAQAPPSGGHPHGPGPFWRSERARTDLGLTEEQAAKLERDFKETRLVMVDLRATIEKKRMALDDQLEAEGLDESAARSAAADLEAALAQLHQAEIGHEIALRRILTAEQFQKLRAMRPPTPPRHRGPGGPGGPAGQDGPGPMGMNGPDDGPGFAGA